MKTNSYSYTKEGNDPLFTFLTKHGLEYYVSFKKMDLENENFNRLYAIDFGELNNKKFIKDDLIENTIIEIIFDFFTSYPDSLLHYVCDNIDNKQLFRSKLFDKWYSKSDNKEFSKLEINYEIHEEEIHYKLEFIFKNEFHNIKIVKQHIKTQLDDFSNMK